MNYCRTLSSSTGSILLIAPNDKTPNIIFGPDMKYLAELTQVWESIFTLHVAQALVTIAVYLGLLGCVKSKMKPILNRIIFCKRHAGYPSIRFSVTSIVTGAAL